MRALVTYYSLTAAVATTTIVFVLPANSIASVSIRLCTSITSIIIIINGATKYAHLCARWEEIPTYNVAILDAHCWSSKRKDKTLANTRNVQLGRVPHTEMCNSAEDRNAENILFFLLISIFMPNTP